MEFWSGFWIGAACGYVVCLAGVVMVLALCHAASRNDGDVEGACENG